MANPTVRHPTDLVAVPTAAGSLVAPPADGAVLFRDSENGGLLTAKTDSTTGTTFGFGIFGDGSDGACAFDGSTVVLGMTPSTNVYTMTRDIFASSITVAAGVTVKASGFRIFCTGATTIAATGVIHCNGKDASAGTAGAITNASGSLGAGTAGGNGGSGNNAGSGGTAHSAGFPASTGVCAGGAGGGDGTHGAAAAGAWTVLADVKGGARFLTPLLTGQVFGTGTSGTVSAVSLFMGGTGGGGGGGNNADATGGGGGGGGGVLVLATAALVNNGTVSCNGGAGAAGTSAANNAGGGGGGGGGVCIVVYTVKTGTGTITASAGTGGAKAGAGGVAGSAGSAGVVINMQV